MIYSMHDHPEHTKRMTVGYISVLFGILCTLIIMGALHEKGAELSWQGVGSWGNALILGFFAVSLLAKILRVLNIMILPIDILSPVLLFSGLIVSSIERGAPALATTNNTPATGLTILAGFLILAFPMTWFSIDVLDIDYYLDIRKEKQAAA